jgi:hypothetical protein
VPELKFGTLKQCFTLVFGLAQKLTALILGTLQERPCLCAIEECFSGDQWLWLGVDLFVQLNFL